MQCSCVHEYLDEALSIPVDNGPVRTFLEHSTGRLSGAEAVILDDGTIWNRIYRRDMVSGHGLCFKTVCSSPFRFEKFLYQTVQLSACNK